MPDGASKAKIDIFTKYFGIYFKIIDPTRILLSKKFNKRFHIKFFDLFCGPGVFFENGTVKYESTPIKVLKNINKNQYNDLSVFFNDINPDHISVLEKYISDQNFNFNDNVHLFFTVEDARNVDLSNLISKNDIVLSLIDSYSYLGLESSFINKLTENKFSDLVCFFRVTNIITHIGNVNEKKNHIALFGGEKNYLEVLAFLKQSGKTSLEKAQFILSKWIATFSDCDVMKYFLPIFIKFSHDDTNIESVVTIISKNKKGLTKVKSMLYDYEIIDGNTYSYIGSDQSQIKLFDYEDDIIKQFIKNSNKRLNCSQLLDLIDEKFVCDYRYISGYSEKKLKECLSRLENDSLIEISYANARKRVINTFGDDTLFRMKD